MYKKHIEHLLMVSLKHFFDFDYSYFHNAYLMMLTIPFMVKVMIVALGAYLYEGLTTVKEDLNGIKSATINIVNSRQAAGIRESFTHSLRVIKSNLTERRFNIR